MKKLILSGLCIATIALTHAQNAPIQINADASKQIATVTDLFNGTNIEDLNNQTNGGLFSQLLHGEAFEENVETADILKLPREDYSKVFVILDENRNPHFLSTANAYTRVTWNNLSELYDVNSKDIYDAVNPIQRQDPTQPNRRRVERPMRLGPLSFYGRYVLYDSIPEPYRSQIVSRINGNEQISRYWDKVVSGSASGSFILQRGNAYMGRQGQIISFTGGSGELGLYNAGLYKSGIHFEGNKPYEGVLRVKATQSTTIYLSARDENNKVLAEVPYTLKGDGSFEKVTFQLTPTASTFKGHFGITLKQQGRIELGFAFLQAGDWGRVNGLPVRKEFVDALKKQGIKVIRYNGSMVDVGVDTYLYRWKNMIGPVDERRVCFRNGFNPYATTSFGLIEACQFAEAIGATAVTGMCLNETYQDIRDYVEYMNGAVTTHWGALRAKHGHPAPYNLKYIEVDNERPMTVGYVECVKKFALASWEVDPEMHISLSLNIGSNPDSYARGTQQYELSKGLIGWFIAQGKPNNVVWDAHYSGAVNFADTRGFDHEMGVDLQAELTKDFPGYKLTLCDLEENGSRCDWDRGLAHAHNWNTLQRYGTEHFTMLATANTFQPEGLHYMWDQGRVHYTPDAMWFMPSAYIDEKISSEKLYKVVEATSSQDSTLDVTAKLSDDGKKLQLCVVNLSNSPQAAVINISNFGFKTQAQTWMIGNCELTATNTYANQTKVVPVMSTVNLKKKNASYTFPKYSYTIITLTK